MPEHVHRCLSCTPDMVPDFDRADPRYHEGEKCGSILNVTLDGQEISYTRGIFEGREGWVLFAGADTESVHHCPTCTTRTDEGFIARYEVCVEPLFGVVTVEHSEARR
jgi:hypothetical protein